MNGCGERNLTYCAIGRLGIIPVVGCEMMEPVEDILVRHTRQAGWRVGPGNESGGRGGHGKSQRRRGEMGMRGGVSIVVVIKSKSARAGKDKRTSLLSISSSLRADLE